MARRPTQQIKRPANLTVDEMKAGIARLERRVEEIRKFEPTSIKAQYDIPELKKLSAAVDETLVRTFGSDTTDYERYKNASYFDNGPHNYAYKVPISEVHQSLARSKGKNIALLEQAADSLKERLAEVGLSASIDARSIEKDANGNRKVFVVHGHAGLEQHVARYLEKIGFHPIILHEQANQGKTIIEKFELHSDVGFAVVLLTDDDMGGSSIDELRPRARQNVVLELGYFIGKLGRDRVCALKKGDIEIPSDILGVLWQQLDDQGAWKQGLAKELQAVGYAIDWNRVMG